MSRPIRVLLVEDNEDDALLVLAELRGAGYQPEYARVETREEMADALAQQPWDLVLADYSLPRFSAPEALRLLQQTGLDIPFLVVSGAVGEETAAAIMRAGAHDYFLKDNLARLPAAIGRELCEAEVRRQRSESQARLREEEFRYRTLFELSPDGILLFDPETTLPVEFNDAACGHLGYTREEFAPLRIADYEAVESPEEIRRRIAQILLLGRADFETRHRAKTGAIRIVHVTVQTITLCGRTLLYTIFRDVTEHTQAQQEVAAGEDRYRRLLSAVTTYTYSVTVDRGTPVATEHSSGSLAVTGYAPQEYQADPALWIRMVYQDDRDLVRRYVERVLASDTVPPLEHRIVHRNGSIRWVRDTVVLRRNRNGDLVRYDGLIEDITARRIAEQELCDHQAQLLAAGEIQQRLLPHEPPTIPGFDIAAGLYPAEVAAGDYYDYLPMPGGSMGFVIADVAGHRFGSAILMASTRAYLRSLSHVHTSVVEILEMANQILMNELEENYFVTMLLARLHPRTRYFVYASAGHETGYVFNAAGEIKAEWESTGLPLGVMEDAEYLPGGHVVLEPGDLVFLMTDGLYDIRSPADERFGISRAQDVVRSNRDRPAEEIIRSLYEAVCRFSGSRKRADDVTAMILKAEGAAS